MNRCYICNYSHLTPSQYVGDAGKGAKIVYDTKQDRYICTNCYSAIKRDIYGEEPDLSSLENSELYIDDQFSLDEIGLKEEQLLDIDENY